MKKRIAAIAIAVVLCMPCALILNEHLNLWNLVGLAWLAFLVGGGLRLMVPAWVWKELQDYCQEQEDASIFRKQ